MNILVVDDEKEIADVVELYLQNDQYKVFKFYNGQDALDCINSTKIDLAILDIMLPDGNGYDICKKFRKTSDNPVVFLSGKSGISDKVYGLEHGGDYYLTKPYSFDELVAVSERLLRRHFKECAKHEQLGYITKGSLKLDVSKNKAFVNGRDAGLTVKEFALLLILIKNENNTVSLDELYDAVWGVPSVNDTRTIRFHIGNLKKKIDTENSEDYDIVSVYGKGYSFTTD